MRDAAISGPRFWPIRPSPLFEIAPESEAEIVGVMEKNFLARLRALDSRLGRA
jgi:hypothetical protein